MKTNVSIDLTDDQRNRLACLIAGKPVKRLATRKEIANLAVQHLGGLLGATTDPWSTASHEAAAKQASDLYKPDPRDIPLMARPNDPGYVRGWNLVKRGAK
jgi:hypothetical protein